MQICLNINVRNMHNKESCMQVYLKLLGSIRKHFDHQQDIRCITSYPCKLQQLRPCVPRDGFVVPSLNE